MRRWRVVSAAATALLGVIGVGLVWATASDEQVMELSAVRGSQTGYGFVVEAQPVAGLYPGADKQLKISFANPYGFDLQVTGMKTELLSSSKKNCEANATNLVVQRYSGTLPLVVPAKGTRKGGAVPLHMPTSVVNECQGVTFKIRISGQATKAARR